MTQDRENKENMRPRGLKTRYKTQDKITRPMTLSMEKTQDKTEEATRKDKEKIIRLDFTTKKTTILMAVKIVRI